jgi:hypothetical protein
MTIRNTRGVRTQRGVGDPLPQQRARRLVVRFFGSCALFVAALASLMAGSLAFSSAGPSGASLPVILVNCPADSLANAIFAAPAGSTIQVSGTCTGNFYIDKDLTLTGPATLDGGGVPTQFGSTLNVDVAGTVVLNNLVIQNGVGIDNIGGGIWNSGQLTLNDSAVTHNNAGTASGIFNQGQLTLKYSTVSSNTSTFGTGGIFNCGGNLSFESFNLCKVPTSLTLINSSVSNNVAGSVFGSGGIDNDLQGTLTLNSSTVSGNTGSIASGGITNQGAMTLNSSTVSGNTGSTGGVFNEGTATLNKSTVSNNVAGSGFGSSGGLSTTDTSTTTINNSIIQANSEGFVGGGIFAGGPIQINNCIVTDNTAGVVGGAMFVWNGATAVINSTFSDNTDPGAAPPPLPQDNPAGVWVAPPNFFGPGSNNPTFTTKHSTYS